MLNSRKFKSDELHKDYTINEQWTYNKKTNPRFIYRKKFEDEIKAERGFGFRFYPFYFAKFPSTKNKGAAKVRDEEPLLSEKGIVWKWEIDPELDEKFRQQYRLSASSNLLTPHEGEKRLKNDTKELVDLAVRIGEKNVEHVLTFQQSLKTAGVVKNLTDSYESWAEATGFDEEEQRQVDKNNKSNKTPPREETFKPITSFDELPEEWQDLARKGIILSIFVKKNFYFFFFFWFVYNFIHFCQKYL